MGSGRGGVAEDTSGLTYPSPGAEAIDSGPFYNSSNRDGNTEIQDQAEQHAVAGTQGQEEGQEQPHTISQPPSSPSNHVPRPANLEELQLAAQLGQGLASAAMLSATDPHMNADDPNLRTIMPHPVAGPEQHHAPSYAQEPPSADAIIQHQMPVAVGPPPQYPMVDGIPPRKRSKVSRACDTCRRKKIKCDAPTDSGETPCSSCARSKEPCLFSRVPQKRGPSKGYIKELADRIHSIENKLESDGNLSQDDIDKLFATDRSRQSNGPEDNVRKRPFSSISAADFVAPHGARQAPWGSPAPGANDGFDQGYHNTSLAPHPEPPKVDDTTNNVPVETTDAGMLGEDEAAELDEQAYHDFLVSVQPVYPILPDDRNRLLSLLSQAAPAVKTAFRLALPSVGHPSSGDAKIASSLLHEWENSDAPRNRATDIVHLQAILMLIIDADWRATSTLPFLLARGVALANSMKIWKPPSVEVFVSHDCDEQLCVRLWWSMVLLDRWHAAGNGQPPFIPDRSAVPPAGLENVVGEVCFYLLRLSKLLTRVSFVISTLQTGANAADPCMAAILTDYIENYREDLPAHIDAAAYPMIHLAYWHCRLLVTLLTPGVSSKEILWPTKELAHLLSVSTELKSPLMNHFVSLAAMALRELATSDVMHDEVLAIVQDITEKPSGGHWDPVRERLGELLRAPSSPGPDALAIQGLQHLADLATAHEPEDTPIGSNLATGYLDAST